MLDEFDFVGIATQSGCHFIFPFDEVNGGKTAGYPCFAGVMLHNMGNGVDTAMDRSVIADIPF